MPRVAVIDPFRPEKIMRGESDLKRHDGMYYRVVFDGESGTSAAMQLTAIAYVWKEEDASAVQEMLLHHQREKRALETRQYQDLNNARNLWGAQ